MAVKLLRGEYAQHPEIVARFRAEAQHAGSLSHPGIAQVYDYGEADPPHSPYLVMELVDGPSLAGGPLDPARAMDVVFQAAAGLDAAHRAGLVHRDIKPGNLLLSRAGEVKITDFGIAHAVGSAPITRMGTLVGTPAYLAPERAAGGTATPASDLYSLRVVAYECLAGAPPFSGVPLEVLAAHQHAALPPLPRAVPAGAAALIAELTAKAPAARPASAAEVATQARRLCDAMTLTATVQLTAGSHVPPATGSHAQSATLRGLPVIDPLPAHRRLRGTGHGAGRAVALAVAAAAVTAGPAGWLLAGAFGAVPQQRAASRSAAPAHSASAIDMVSLNGEALAGQPVNEVAHRLRQLGLQPRVMWVRSAQQAPGTVVSVQPSGQVPVGSIVTVTASLQSHGHGHGDGDGDGGG